MAYNRNNNQNNPLMDLMAALQGQGQYNDRRGAPEGEEAGPSNPWDGNWGWGGPFAGPMPHRGKRHEHERRGPPGPPPPAEAADVANAAPTPAPDMEPLSRSPTPPTPPESVPGDNHPRGHRQHAHGGPHGGPRGGPHGRGHGRFPHVEDYESGDDHPRGPHGGPHGRHGRHGRSPTGEERASGDDHPRGPHSGPHGGPHGRHGRHGRSPTGEERASGDDHPRGPHSGPHGGPHGRHGRHGRSPTGEERASGDDHPRGPGPHAHGDPHGRHQGRSPRVERHGRGGHGGRGGPGGRRGGPFGGFGGRGGGFPFGGPRPHHRGGMSAFGPGGFDMGTMDLNNLANMFQTHLFGGNNDNTNAETNKDIAMIGADNDGTFRPAIDVFDTPSSYIIHASLPGAKKVDIDVSFNAAANAVVLAGVISRPAEVDEEMLSALAQDERAIGMFERSVTLAAGIAVDVEGISAKLEDGILRVEVPKIQDEWTEVKRVDIE